MFLKSEISNNFYALSDVMLFIDVHNNEALTKLTKFSRSLK